MMFGDMFSNIYCKLSAQYTPDCYLVCLVMDESIKVHNHCALSFSKAYATFYVQGDQSGCVKPPVDIKTKVPF